MSYVIAEVIDERQHTHGDFRVQGAFANELKRMVADTPNFVSLQGHQQEAIELMLTKISRLCYGDAQHADTWQDIAGYALLGMPGRDSV